LRVFVPTYQWHGYSDINMFVDDTTLKHARRSAEVAIHFRTRDVLQRLPSIKRAAGRSGYSNPTPRFLSERRKRQL
jgi:hypothetical protein